MKTLAVGWGRGMMFRSVGTFAGLAGVSLVLASFVVSGTAQGTDARVAVASAGLERSGKGDRGLVATPARAASRVTSVELVGVTNTTVILRDREGTVVFQSDPVTNTTLVGKDVDIPTVTVKEVADSATQPQPARRRETREEPARSPKRAMPVGCEGVVSVLVSGDSRRVPGLCLAQAEVGRQG